MDSVSQFVHLKRMPKEKKALAMLQHVASLVKPIMKSRGYKVKTLAEFYPKQTNLLGTNYGRGLKISLRLRPHYNRDEFLPLEAIIETMLHELTHNQFGAHDAKFYALLDDLNVEYDKLMISGYRGEGWYSKGYTLGGGSNPDSGKTAAEARARSSKRGTGPEGRKLGSVTTDKTLRELVVEAAERRLKDSKWCASNNPNYILVEDEEEVTINDESLNSGTVPDSNKTTQIITKVNEHVKQLREAELNSGQVKGKPEVIEISSDEEILPAKTTTKKRRCSQDQTSNYKKKTTKIPTSDIRSQAMESWQCNQCTLLNFITMTHCGVCNNPKPPADNDLHNWWQCPCKEWNERQFWVCRNCLTVKQSS